MNLFYSFLISLLASIVAIVLTLLIQRIRLPRLEIKPEEEGGGYRNYEGKGRWKFLRVSVSNKQTPWVLRWGKIPRQTAENCRAILEFSSSKDGALVVMRGRWISTPEIPHVARDGIIERVLYPDPVSILAGGKEILDVIIQEENDSNAYGWNNEAYLNRWKTPKYKLSEGDYKVKINITTQNGVSFSDMFKLKVRKILELTILEV